MIRIGAVNIETSHPKEFVAVLEQDGRAGYTAVFHDGFRGDREVEAFMRASGASRRCATVEELADAVDVGFIHGVDWDRHLDQVRAFVARGKPVFVDKPVAGNVRDCLAIEAMAASGAMIHGGSSLRCAAEIQDFIHADGFSAADVLGVFGTAGVDEFNYSIHIVEAMEAILGSAARSCRFIAAQARSGRTAETYQATHPGGATAIWSSTYGQWQRFELVVSDLRGVHHLRIDTGQVYRALIGRLVDALEGRAGRLHPVRESLGSIRTMLAGRISRAEGGREVAVDAIPADDPGYDGATFARSYAATAKALYA